nr:hypothetical protein BaRGS_029479 [Batillaria attramentaria]
MSVIWPHRVAFLCSFRKSGLAVFFIVVTAGASQGHILYGLRVYDTAVYLDGACAASADYEQFWNSVWPWIDMSLFSLFPSVILLASNAVLVKSLRQSASQVSSMGGGSSAADSRKKVASSMTVTLISISITFLLLTSPIVITIILYYLLGDVLERDARLAARMDLAWAVTNMLWYANSAVNFLLYCLSGSRHGITIIAIVVFEAVWESHQLYGLEAHDLDVHVDGACSAASGNYEEFWESIWPWLEMVINSSVPSLTLVICNVALVRSLRRSTRYIANCSNSSSTGASSRKKTTSSTTVTILVISVTFLLLAFPIDAVIIAWSMLDDKIQTDPRLEAKMELAWVLCNMSWYTNSAVNFPLYCLSGSRFRQEFVKCFKCNGKQAQKTFNLRRVSGASLLIMVAIVLSVPVSRIDIKADTEKPAFFQCLTMTGE